MAPYLINKTPDVILISLNVPSDVDYYVFINQSTLLNVSFRVSNKHYA